MPKPKQTNLTEPYTKSAIYYDKVIDKLNCKVECDKLEEIFNHYKVKPKYILDFGCGTGPHSIELGKRGYIVTGLDKNEEMLSIAREKESKNVTFLISQYGIPYEPNKYDVCISMWNVIGYLSQKDLRVTFRRIRDNIKKNGLFIFDCFNGPAVYRIRPKLSHRGYKNIEKFGTPTFDEFNQTLDILYEYKVNGKKTMSEIHKIRVYMPLEIKECLEISGFELISTGILDNRKDDWNIQYVARAI